MRQTDYSVFSIDDISVLFSSKNMANTVFVRNGGANTNCDVPMCYNSLILYSYNW